MRISVIIPTLNEQEDLPILLESLSKQSLQDFEVIVADAGSKDNTVKIAKKHKAKVVPGGMPGVGRNRGAEAAIGEYLFFLDADVKLPPDFLQKATDEMDDRFLDLATCEFHPDSDLKLDDIMFRFANLSVKMNQDINPRAAGFCIFITNRLFRRIGGFDESLKLAEDHDLVQRASRFRPLRVLQNAQLFVSVRRLEKEGRFSLIQKYFKVEMHLLFKGNVKEDIVDYEFGNFARKSENSKWVDDLERKIIQMEKAYSRLTGPRDEPGTDGKPSKEKNDLFEKMKAGLDTLIDALTRSPAESESSGKEKEKSAKNAKVTKKSK
ncbi:MAG: glycosyltransferase [Leptospiraceae bacterium]|nr:glycosyltransferase [Leptospiraceae bacterium]